MKFVRSPIVTARTIVALLLLLILVSIRVKSSCFDEDCADPAIKVISRSSRECVTCYRCSPCPEGQKLSVPCPSTVVEGTDINCVPIVAAGPSGVSISRASAYATDVFFTLLASPSAISGYSSPTEAKQITETRVIGQIHNQPSVSATSSTGSHSSITVAVLGTMDDSGTGQDSYVTIAILSSSVGLLMFTILAILFILKKRGSFSLLFLCNDNGRVRPNLTSGSGDNELCSVLFCPENHTASYANQKLKDTDQQDSTCQENDQLLQHDPTFSGEETIPSSLDDYCGLGEDQQHAVNEGATAVDVAGSSQDPTLQVSTEKPSSLFKDLKPGVPPNKCITPNVNTNLTQTSGGQQQGKFPSTNYKGIDKSKLEGSQLLVSFQHSSSSSSVNIVSHPVAPTSSSVLSVEHKVVGLHSPVQFNMVFPPHYPVLTDNQYHDIWAGGESKLSEESSTNWPKLSQSERYHTRFSQIPFPLLHKICHHLDTKRLDGKDVRKLADKLGFMVPRDFDAIEQAAIRNKDSTTYVVLKEGFLTKKPDATVEDFVEMMKDIGRDDIIDLINDCKGE